MALKDAPADSFNRYMVECKSDYFYYLKQQIDVLIDTWWNVNTLAVDTLLSSSTCFNRYMVECK